MRKFVLTIAISLAWVHHAGATPTPEIEHIDGGTVYLKKAVPLKTRLADLVVLGWLESDATAPYLVLTARSCETCAQERHVYLIRLDGKQSTHFVHPGRVVDPKTGLTLIESRSFFGHCITGYGEVLVTFQKERVDRRRALQQSVHVAWPGKEYLQEKLLERRLPGVHQALHFVRAKKCKEISGRNRLMLSKPLDLTPRHGIDDASDDSTDEEASPPDASNLKTVTQDD